jgi:hypothetical protein
MILGNLVSQKVEIIAMLRAVMVKVETMEKRALGIEAG